MFNNVKLLFVALDSYGHSVEKSCTEMPSFAFQLKCVFFFFFFFFLCLCEWLLWPQCHPTLYERKRRLMIWSIIRVHEWTWWIMRQHTDVIKYGREAASVIKLHAQFEHICPDSWETEMHNRLVNAAPWTRKHQQHVICGLISRTHVVSGALIL